MLSFGSPSWYPTDLTGTSVENPAVVVGDVNGDEVPDLVTARAGNLISIDIGHGDGSFGSPILISTLAPPLAAIKLADLDGRKGLDILATAPDGKALLVLLNDGTGNFGTQVLTSLGWTPGAIAVAGAIANQNGDTSTDLNGDLFPDIVVTVPGSNQIRVLLGKGDGTFSPLVGFPPTVGAPLEVDKNPVALALGDFNNDGRIDLVTANKLASTLTLLLGMGDGTFRQAQRDIPVTIPPLILNGSVINPDSAPCGVAVGDFNGDGNLDLVTANWGYASVSVLMGYGNGTFRVPQTTATLTGQITPTDPDNPDPPSAVVAADLDGDGFVDIALTEPARGQVGLLQGKGDGTFADRVDNYAQGNIVALTTANLDGDHTSLRYGLQLMSWGDGSSVPTSGQGLVVAGLDASDLLHIRTFESDGRSDTYETIVGGARHLVSADASGKVLSNVLESSLPTDQERAITSLKQMLSGLVLPTPVLSSAERDQVLSKATIITGHTPSLVLDRFDLVTVSKSDTRMAVLLGQRFTSTVTLDASSASTTYGNSARMSILVSVGNAPEGLSLTGTCQLSYIDQDTGQYVLLGDPAPIGSSVSTPLNLAAGSYALVARYSGGVNFLSGYSAPIEFTVSPARLSVTALDKSRTFGAADPDFSYQITGFVPGDPYTPSKVSGQPSFIPGDWGPSSPVGVYTLSVSQGSLHYNDSNYMFDLALFIPGKLTVQPAPVIVTALDAGHTYGRATTFTGREFTASGLFGGDAVTSVSLTSSGSEAGAGVAGSPYAIVPAAAIGAGLSNYSITYVDGRLTVDPAPLAIWADDQAKDYGATDPALTFTTAGFLFHDTSASVLTGSLARAPGEHVAASPYAIGQGTLAANANYKISFIGSTLTITPAPLAIQADDKTKVYGATMPDFTVNSRGLVNGDTLASLTVQPTVTTAANVGSPIAGGPYTITVSGAMSSDYDITFLWGSLAVTPAPLIVTASNISRTYGRATTFTGREFTASGLFGGDAVTSVSLTSSGSEAGAGVAGSPYAIVPAAAIGAGLSNYSITYVDGRLAVEPAPLAIKANDQSKVYGDTDPALTFSAGATDFQQGDTPAGVLTGSLTRVAGEHVADGPYAITQGSLAANSNYRIFFTSGTLTITPAPLIIQADDKTNAYGARMAVLTASVSGMVNGDAEANLAAVPVVTTSATTDSLPGSYPITVSGAQSSDYAIAFVGATYTIVPSSSYAVMDGPALRAAARTPVTFVVHVVPSSGGSLPLSGNVAFYDGNRIFGTAPVVNGTATLMTSALAQGNHLIYAEYQGDGPYSETTTGTITQMVLSSPPLKHPNRRTPVVSTHPKKIAPKPKTKPKSHPVAGSRKHAATPVRNISKINNRIITTQFLNRTTPGA